MLPTIPKENLPIIVLYVKNFAPNVNTQCCNAQLLMEWILLFGQQGPNEFNFLGIKIYTYKMNQPGIFSRFKPDNFQLSTARFSGYNLDKCTG